MGDWKVTLGTSHIVSFSETLKLYTLVSKFYVDLVSSNRAMELGRECLELWGYERVDELIWVKTNQLQRIIRTGRTGKINA